MRIQRVCLKDRPYPFIYNKNKITKLSIFLIYRFNTFPATLLCVQSLQFI
ncbi:hypothetical protein pb186bvf_004863 [Paramecium bursaria]